MGNQDETKQVTVYGMLKGQSFKGELQKALGKGVDVERYLRGVLTAVSLGSRQLQQCDPISVAQCVLTSAQLDMEIDARGHGYIVPYGRTAQFIPGYKGYISKAREIPDIAAIYVEVVYREDTFSVTKGLHPDIIHKANLESATFGNDEAITHLYAIVKFKSGEFEYEVMSRRQIEDIVPMKDGHPTAIWKKHWGEMARKTVFRRLAKKLQFPKLQKLVDIDTAVDSGHSAHVHAGEVVISEKPVHNVEQKETPEDREAAITSIVELVKQLAWTQDQTRDNMIGAIGKDKFADFTYEELQAFLDILEQEVENLKQVPESE